MRGCVGPRAGLEALEGKSEIKGVGKNGTEGIWVCAELTAERH
jgi:hypothetical protein